jgi:(3S)-malyl-CoA thioesterase
MQGFVMGTNDLAKELGSRFRSDRLPLMGALQTCLLAARATGKICIDGVYNAFKDEAGLRVECEQGRDLGMDGKSLIHPLQVATANDIFGPSEAEIDLARRQIAAFDAAVRDGQGVAVLDGRIVENLHVATAKVLLETAQLIAEMEGA